MPINLWPKGRSANPSGRPKGSKNKGVYRKEVWQACEDTGVDPFVVLAQISHGILDYPPSGKYPDGHKRLIMPKLRKEASAELCSYLRPKLKAVQIISDLIGEEQEEIIRDEIKNHEREY